MDMDEKVIEKAKENLSEYSKHIRYYNDNFKNINKILEAAGVDKVNGILFDLGLSTFQLEDDKRGFSFMNDGPLDMRMSGKTEIPAIHYINNLDERRLNEIIAEFGEERWAKRIARAIVKRREKGEIKTSAELAEIIRRAVPQQGRYGRIHPATRAFQAVRILVNDELESLKHALPAAVEHLKNDGRVCVISFHSLEDRIVKRYFRERKQENKAPNFEILTPKPVMAAEAEKAENKRCRSAKLRAGRVIYG
jgi:16S rRNA (cytosine1402-N4)-methyltransferase